MTELLASKPVILVVDDSRLMRVAARKILKAGFEIEEAPDGEVAWDTLQKDGRITLVMSDLSMPHMDGLELLEKIRTADDCRLRELPVIIVTGAEDDDGSKKTALAAGASDFITKPFDSIQLVARTRSQINQQRTRQDLKHSEDVKQNLEKHSRLDSLTGLANARAFTDRLEDDISYAKRHRTELAVVQIRIDRYKILFLRKGKQVAEEVLQKLAGMFTRTRRQEDTVARLSLDTFAILMPSANHAGAGAIAETLRADIERLVLTEDGPELQTSASIAVTTPLIEHGVTAAHLLEDGNTKLDLARKAGGNCVQHQLSAQATGHESPAIAATGDHATTGVSIASPADVHRALDQLAAGKTPDTDLNEIARALLPFLRSWNHSRNRQYTGLVEQLERALQYREAAGARPDTGKAP